MCVISWPLQKKAPLLTDLNCCLVHVDAGFKHEHTAGF